MEIKAQVKFVRMSPRKTRLVADLVRGLDVDKAKDQLQFMPKVASKPILKLLNSAIANAVNNFKLKKENLYIKAIMVDGGPVLKRWRPRAFGRAAPIRKRSAHIKLVLVERVESERPAEIKPAVLEKPKVVETLKNFTKEKAEEESKKTETESKKQKETSTPVKGETKNRRGFLKNIFPRKTGSK
ncbi:MAG: 50S ribosomal protein L22 [Patescibacteria group bacterium]